MRAYASVDNEIVDILIYCFHLLCVEWMYRIQVGIMAEGVKNADVS